MIGTLLQDLRYAVRMMIKSPGLTAVAALTLTLGIGANSAIFSGVSAFVLRPLPVEEPDRLVRPFETDNPDEWFGNFSYPDYVDYREQNDVFEGMLAHNIVQAALSRDNQNDLVWGELVSGNYFDVLHVSPAMGRGFLPEEDKTPGSHPVVVLGHSLWERRFDRDASIVGRSVTLNGQDYTVVGVAPKEFRGTKFGLGMDFWVPMMMQAQITNGTNLLDDRGSHWLEVVARLKPGVTEEQAAAALTTISARLAEAYPNERSANLRVVVLPETRGRFDDASGTVALGSGLAMAVVGLILLIACANVANLLLARGMARRREIGIRLALGASRGRLIRQLLTESCLLALVGGGLGLLLAFWITDLMYALIPVLPYTIVLDFAPDARALAFTLVISLVTGVIFGLAPAWQASNPDVVPVLKGETVSFKQGSSRFSLRNMLVVSQVALSMIVLVCGGLFIQSFQKARLANPGFNPENAIAFSMNPGLLGYTPDQSKEFYRQLIERTRSLPGVETASVANLLPLGDGSNSTGPLIREGEEPPRPGEGIDSLVYLVGPGYFETMQAPIVRGREFSETDRADRPRVAIINETLARRLWPDQDAVGKRMRVGGTNSALIEIVGVARDGRYRSIGERPRFCLYYPAYQRNESGMTLLVRTTGDPEAFVGAVRQEIQHLDARLPIYNVKTLKQHLTWGLWGPRMAATLSLSFGFVALLLAATGLYSVMAYTVSQRTREIGIRMALGATRSDILKLVASQGMTLAAVGVVIGLIAAFAVTRAIGSLLVGVSSTDPVTYAIITAGLLVVALTASYTPARRATKVDPMVALRHE